MGKTSLIKLFKINDFSSRLPAQVRQSSKKSIMQQHF